MASITTDSGADRSPVPPRSWERVSWLASFALHVTLLAALATTTWLVAPPSNSLLYTPVEEPDVADPEEVFRVSEQLTIDLGALSDGGVGDAAAAAPNEADLSEVALEVTPIVDFGQLPTLEATTPVMMSPDPESSVVVQGVGAVGATGARGAVDRLTGEILNSLDQRPTVVVWLFDRSASLRPQREEMLARFDRVYEQLGAIGEDREFATAPDGQPALLTVIGAFGASQEFVTRRPTGDLDEIKSAVRSIDEDDSGSERVFSAVLESAERHRRFRLKEPRRNVMLIVVTDEAGDDAERLDAAVQKCRKLRMPVYAVGAPAPFGRAESYVRYVDPDPRFDQSVQWLPVRQGPESLRAERLKLGVIGAGDFEGPMLDSGFGPFGLTRLCAETGGFFIAVHPLRVDSGRAKSGETDEMIARLDYFFDTRLMRRYRPDYVTLPEYERRLRDSPARAALVRAASLSWAEPLSNVRRVFPAVDEAEFVESLNNAQRAAARVEPQLREILATLRRGERGREAERSPRWRAGFDLAMGRALSAEVRAVGYNAMLGAAKGGLRPTQNPSDTWVLRPASEGFANSTLEAAAADAERYLARVVEDHPGTPWGLLAKRELNAPRGWQWRDAFRNLAAQREMQRQVARQRPRGPAPQPPRRRDPPKL
ncbi:MAG: vWA domain-containing protein [Planctomycetota bacterium]